MMMIQLVLLLELLTKLPSKLLSLPCFMILKPIEHILAFNLAVKGEVGSDLLNLRSIWSSNPTSIQFL